MRDSNGVFDLFGCFTARLSYRWYLGAYFIDIVACHSGLISRGQFPGLISLSIKDHQQQSGFAVGLVFSISSLGMNATVVYCMHEN